MSGSVPIESARDAIQARSSFNLIDAAHGLKSERQWRDVVGILRIHGDAMQLDYLHETARELNLGALLDHATNAANAD